MTLKVIIVDDEPLALSLLSSILDEIVDVQIIASCSSGREAVEAVQAHAPDVLFLDIQMPEMNGFDVIAAIQNDIMPLVIFTTAYAEFAVDAFKVQALDYVLKPLDDQLVKNSLDRARLVLQGNATRKAKPELLTALNDISNRVQGHRDFASNALIVKDSDKISFLDKSKIEWFEAAGDYVCIHMGGVTRIIRSTLKAIEADLTGEQFKRIHRSTIINVTQLKDIIPAAKGEAYAVMKHGNRLKVSRRYGAEIRQLLH